MSEAQPPVLPRKCPGSVLEVSWKGPTHSGRPMERSRTRCMLRIHLHDPLRRMLRIHLHGPLRLLIARGIARGIAPCPSISARCSAACRADIEGFSRKNRDTISSDLADLVRESRCKWLQANANYVLATRATRARSRASSVSSTSADDGESASLQAEVAAKANPSSKGAGGKEGRRRDVRGAPTPLRRDASDGGAGLPGRIKQPSVGEQFRSQLSELDKKLEERSAIDYNTLSSSIRRP